MNNYYSQQEEEPAPPTPVYYSNCDCYHNHYPDPNPPPGRDEWGGRRSYKDYPKEERVNPPIPKRMSSFQEHNDRYYGKQN